MAEELANACRIFPGSLAFLKEELGEHETGKTCCSVERGKSKYGDSECQHAVHDRVDACTLFAEHCGDTACKSSSRGAESAGGVLLEYHADSKQRDDAESGLDEHRAVADGLEVLLGSDLLGRSTGSDE